MALKLVLPAIRKKKAKKDAQIAKAKLNPFAAGNSNNLAIDMKFRFVLHRTATILPIVTTAIAMARNMMT